MQTFVWKNIVRIIKFLLAINEDQLNIVAVSLSRNPAVTHIVIGDKERSVDSKARGLDLGGNCIIVQ